MAIIVTKAVIPEASTVQVETRISTEKKRPKNVDDILFVKVYDSSKPADRTMAALREERTPQIVRDLMSHAINILKNQKLKPPQQVEKLAAFSRQLRSGWPFKNTQRLTRYSTLLSEKVLAMANTILAIEKVKSGRKDDKTGTIEE